MNTKLIATIGPKSESDEVLNYFKEHDVQIGKLKTAYNTNEWHQAMGLNLKSKGLEVWFDLTGPKVIFGDLGDGLTLKEGEEVYLTNSIEKVEGDHIPVSYDISTVAGVDQIVLALDGLFRFEVTEVLEGKVKCIVVTGGTLVSNKALLVPGCTLDLNPVPEEDKEYLKNNLVLIKPEWIAVSFIRNIEDINVVKSAVQEILDDAGVTDYFPKLAIKVETNEALEDENLKEIVANSDLVIVARGDLAIEVFPLHTNVPFNQQKIVDECKKQGVEVCIATQLLMSMMDSPTPLRSETSDIYRAVYTDEAEYLYLSNETAVGKYPKEVVKVASDIIRYNDSK